MRAVVTTYIQAEIARWISDDFPGFVEWRFSDKFGKEWRGVDKAPVLTTLTVRSDSQFPLPVLIACEVIATRRDSAGREIADITTKTPWGIAATDGTTVFQLYAEQLQSDRDNI
jgi:hypothetical protein